MGAIVCIWLGSVVFAVCGERPQTSLSFRYLECPNVRLLCSIIRIWPVFPGSAGACSIRRIGAGTDAQ
jgi:hypothetical protein